MKSDLNLAAVWFLIGILPVFTLAVPAQAQAPFIDGKAKPLDAQKAVRAVVPRGVGQTQLYGSGNLLETPPLDVDALLREDEAQRTLGPSRVGVVQEFDPHASGDSGLWTELADGGWLWTMAFHAPDAAAVRIRVRPWNPPVGAELIVYDGYDPAFSFGPFGARDVRKSNEFWTPTVYSDEVRLEYYLPPGLDHLAPESQIAVDGLVNQYRQLPGIDWTQDSTAPIELSCHLDVTCYPVWDTEAATVAALTYIANPGVGQFFCSGNLMNRVPDDDTPFFQTARHCGVDTQSEADSVLITWFYQTDTCNGTPPNPATLPQTSGAVLLVDNAAADYTLIGLESGLPGGVWYAGWDAGYWATSSGATGIHHPGGTYKRISIGSKVGDVASSCVGGSSWWIRWPNGSGELEPGSSGSPIFDDSHRVRGTASCANWDCTTANDGIYGRFDVAFPVLEPYLYRNDTAEWDAYVDGGYTGTEWGTLAQPLKTVLKGVFAVKRGETVFIDAGSYDETITIDKAMTLSSLNGTASIGQ